MGCEGVLWDPGTPWVSSPLDDVGLPEQRIADGHVQVAEVESRGLGPAAASRTSVAAHCSDLSRRTPHCRTEQSSALDAPRTRRMMALLCVRSLPVHDEAVTVEAELHLRPDL